MNKGISIIWASDGSDASLASSGAIRTFLAPVASRITVVTVAPHDGSKFLLQNVLRVSLPANHESMAAADAAAERTVSALSDLAVPFEKSVVWGNASQEIIKAAGEQGADIIVLGVKPRGVVNRIVLGDTGLQVLESTSASVLLTRPQSPQRSNAVVLLCDGPQHFRAAVNAVKQLDLQVDMRIYLAGFLSPPRLSYGVLPSFSEYDRHLQEAARAERQRTLEALFDSASQTLSVDGRSIKRLVIEDTLEVGLEKLVADVQPSLIVVGAGPFGTSSYSSTAGAINVALQVPCSVLVVR